MRKLILTSVLLMASASAQADERVLSLGVVDTSAAAATSSAPQPPAAQADSKPQANDPAVQPRAPKPPSQARRYDSDEARARRIAAKYGISW